MKTPLLPLQLFCLMAMMSLPIAAWAQVQPQVRPSDLFDYTIEYFSMTQIKPKGKAPGGPGGHADIYIKGMCKDYTKAYPALIPCAQVKKFPPGLEHDGVGITIDNDFTTTALVVVPTKRLFLQGMPVEGVLDAVEIEATIDEAIKWRVFEGVKVKESLVSSALPADQYVREVARNAIGTDIAMRYGRGLQGVEFRTNRSAMQSIATYVNEFNEPFVSGREKYVWSGFKGNCAHLSAGILHEACVRNSIASNQPWYKQIFNIALPRNGLSTVQTLVHRGGRSFIQEVFSSGKSGIEFETIRNNELWWDLLTRGETLPVGLGAISTDYPTYLGDDLYADDVVVKRMPHKIIGANQFSDNVLKRPEFTDLAANFQFWGEALRKAFVDSIIKNQSRDRMLYQNWLARELMELDRATKRLTLGPCADYYDPPVSPQDKLPNNKD